MTVYDDSNDIEACTNKLRRSESSIKHLQDQLKESRSAFWEQEAAVKSLRKINDKLVMKLNRIRKLAPGATRLNQLNEVADELQITIDLDTAMVPEAKKTLEGLVLFVKRLEYDLIDLNTVVWDKKPRDGNLSRSDPNHWRGERP